MMRRYAFTMLELVFVIVIMGIIGKFGVEFLAQAYKGFIFSNVNHTLQSNSEMAVESIAAKLQFRIKDSVIGRDSSNTTFSANYKAIGSSSGTNYDILEWVGSDVDGFRGTSLPYWSGIIDIDNSSATLLDSPQTNTASLNTLIGVLSAGGSKGTASTLNDAAIYFIGSDSDIHGYGWSSDSATDAFTDQSNVMHPIKLVTVAGNEDQLIPRDASDNSTNSFSDIDVYEYYQLAWTAYAVGISDYNTTTKAGTLKLYYDYQPWNGENYKDGDEAIIMENVSAFRFKAVGSVIKIQVCAKSLLINNGDKDYSLCKEKTIF